MGISDHSQAAAYANGLKEEDIMEQRKEIKKINKILNGFKIFHGIEADILPDGEIDYGSKILSGFDFVIASVHSNFTMGEKEMTARIIKAIKNPYVTMLGHPTGRLLLAREPYGKPERSDRCHRVSQCHYRIKRQSPPPRSRLEMVPLRERKKDKNKH